MRLGIDFGTTRTAVSVADRGNYPVVGFVGHNDDTRHWYPSLLASDGSGRVLYGLEAENKLNEPDWTVIRSFKRALAETGPDDALDLGGYRMPVIDVLTGFFHQLAEDLAHRSNLVIGRRETLAGFVAVPANANSNQRFLTLEGFRRAGFQVTGMTNEPSAAGIEFAHRYGARQSGRREHLVVYDLGGGTFDVSVIATREDGHEVITSEGIGRLGGDDFDNILAGLVLEAAGCSSLDPGRQSRLLEACREAKEGLNPNSRRVVVDTTGLIPDLDQVSVPAAVFYESCRPLVERTLELVELAVGRAFGGEDPWSGVSALYMVGGSCDLPIVARILRERYSRRVVRSPYPFAATAIGLAISADAGQRSKVRDRFSRHFGVWREAEHGTRVVFDSIFEKDLPLPSGGQPPLVHTRTYQPAHNIGYFRYLECTRLGPSGEPSGDVSSWDPVCFPYDRQLQKAGTWDCVDVTRQAPAERQVIDEVYACDDRGVIELRIVDKGSGFEQTYRLRKTK